MKKRLIFFLLTIGLLFEGIDSYSMEYYQTNKNKSINKKCKEKIIKGNEFANFWIQFRSFILNKNMKEVISLVKFPFKDNFNDVYDINNSLTCTNKVMFLENYDLIFDKFVIEAIIKNSYRGYDKSYGEFGDIIQKNSYLLITKNPNRPKDLIFKKIRDKYYLIGIQYYE